MLAGSLSQVNLKSTFDSECCYNLGHPKGILGLNDIETI